MKKIFLLILLLNSLISFGIDVDDYFDKETSLPEKIKIIADYYNGKITDKGQYLNIFVKYVNDYYKDHPQELLELFKKDANSVEAFLNRETKVDTWIKTKQADAIHAELIRRIIKRHPEWPQNYIKFYLMEKIFSRCIGMDGTFELIKLKNQTKGLDAEYYFKQDKYMDPDAYSELEKSYKKYFVFYKELISLQDKEIKSFTYHTFSYAFEKRLKALPTLDENKCLPKKPKSNEKSVYKFAIEKFIADLLLTEEARSPLQRKKEDTAFNVNKMCELLRLVADRGGLLDLKGYYIVKNISYLAAWGEALNTKWEDCDRLPDFGILSLQTLIKDKNGKLLYILSFPYGKEPVRNFRNNKKEKAFDFFIAKLVYENDKIVGLMSTRVYSTPLIKECLRKNVYNIFNINLDKIRDSKKLTRFRAFRLKDLGVYNKYDSWDYPYFYFPPFKTN